MRISLRLHKLGRAESQLPTVSKIIQFRIKFTINIYIPENIQQ